MNPRDRRELVLILCAWGVTLCVLALTAATALRAR